MTVSFIAPGSLFSAFVFCPNAPFFCFVCPLFYCYLVPGELETAMKAVQAARGGGKRLGLGGRGGKVGGGKQGQGRPALLLCRHRGAQGEQGTGRQEGRLRQEGDLLLPVRRWVMQLSPLFFLSSVMCRAGTHGGRLQGQEGLIADCAGFCWNFAGIFAGILLESCVCRLWLKGSRSWPSSLWWRGKSMWRSWWVTWPFSKVGFGKRICFSEQFLSNFWCREATGD